MAVSQFRRNIVQDTRQKPRRGGSGGKGSWYDKYRLPVNVPTAIAIVAGQYLDPKPAPNEIEVDAATGQPKPVYKAYKKVKNHRRKLIENGREWYADEACSAGWDAHAPQPCAGCTAMELGDKSVTLQEKFVWTIVHFAQYHGHPFPDRQNPNTFARKQDGSGYMLTYDECKGNACNFCRVLRNQQPVQVQGEQPFPNYPQGSITTIFGRRRYLELGKGHLENLDAWDDRVQSKCGNKVNARTCGMLLEKEGFACPHCHEFLIDLKGEGEVRTYEQAVSQVMDPYPCHNCQKNVLAYEVRVCPACQDDTKTNTLWSTLLVARRTGEGKNSVLTLDDPYSFEDYEPAVRQYLPQGKTLRQVFEEVGQPYDFEEMLKPRSWDDQCRRLKLNLPSPGQPQQYGQQQYGAPQQFAQPPQQPAYAPYPSAPQPGFAQPQPGFGQPQSGPGPAPFQPPGRPNFSR